MENSVEKLKSIVTGIERMIQQALKSLAIKKIGTITGEHSDKEVVLDLTSRSKVLKALYKLTSSSHLKFYSLEEISMTTSTFSSLEVQVIFDDLCQQNLIEKKKVSISQISERSEYQFTALGYCLMADRRFIQLSESK